MGVVGMIGLGIMGSAMSGHLVRAGNEVHGTDVSAAAVEAFAASGGRPAADVAAVAEAAEVVITSLPSAEAVLLVCQQLARAARPGLVVVETSTLSLEVNAARLPPQRHGRPGTPARCGRPRQW
jgi:putative dehydrogenase